MFVVWINWWRSAERSWEHDTLPTRLHRVLAALGACKHTLHQSLLYSLYGATHAPPALELDYSCALQPRFTTTAYVRSLARSLDIIHIQYYIFLLSFIKYNIHCYGKFETNNKRRKLIHLLSKCNGYYAKKIDYFIYTPHATIFSIFMYLKWAKHFFSNNTFIL